MLSRHNSWLFLALILLLAASLRLYRIDAQSFWNDEGNSARLAERSVRLILEGAEGDIHPPGYYLALHYWRALLGHSETALRGLSALCGVALVACTWLLGRRLFADQAVGLAAAALAALNPFQVYYAQEARMYAALALWAVASSWALAEWLPLDPRQTETRRWPLVVYALTAAAGLWTHYAFPFVLLAQNLCVGCWLLTARSSGGESGRRLWVWIAALGAIVALYLPWLPTAWRQVTSWSGGSEPYKLLDALPDVLRLLSFGLTIPTGVVAIGLLAVSFLALVSVLPPADEDDEQPDGLPYLLRWGLAALLVLVPVGLILGLGLYKEAYQKFLLVSSAPLSLLVARGAVGGWRIASGIGTWGEQNAISGYRGVVLLLVALVLFDSARSLDNLYHDSTYARADYRAIARYVEAQARPGDAILLNAPNQWEVFTYYHHDDGHVYPLARQRPLDVAANRAELEQIVGQHQRLFAIFWGDAESDPERFVESWLEANTYKAGETWYDDVRLALYAVPALAADAPATPLDARFGPSIYLDGYTLLTDALVPGDILQLALFWRAVEPVERYKVFVHLYDQSGRLAAQTDSEPGATLRPTNTWSPGEQIVDRYGVMIPLETPPGDYVLAVGLYPVDDPLNRLPVSQDGAQVGDRLDLTRLVVVP
jgi:mannosyltransferase